MSTSSSQIVEWDNDINDKSTKNLYEINMSFVFYQQCLSEISVDFRGYITQ